MSNKETSENESKKRARDRTDIEDTFNKDTCFALFSNRTIDYFMKKNNLDKEVQVDTDKEIPTDKK